MADLTLCWVVSSPVPSSSEEILSLEEILQREIWSWGVEEESRAAQLRLEIVVPLEQVIL